MAQATASAFNKRWDFIQTLWQDNRWLFVFAGWMFGLLTFPLLQLIDTNWRGLLYNLVPEAVGITFTVLILNRLAENRARIELQKRLVREAGSQSNETVKAAVEWLRAEGWLTTKDSIALLKKAKLSHAKLQQADFWQANLQAADLRFANLQAANLWAANLQRVNLFVADLQAATLEQANLQGAYLGQANLQGGDLRETNLQGADLREANLRGADLREANLQAATLWRANLQGTNLGGVNLIGTKDIETATFDEKTVLPDAKRLQNEQGGYPRDENGGYIYDKYWTPKTDMTRYTNPEHPDFWQPEYLKPGYNGNTPWWLEEETED
jgi:uncharacterized protein YjbI with pentapeptide repeats